MKNYKMMLLMMIAVVAVVAVSISCAKQDYVAPHKGNTFSEIYVQSQLGGTRYNGQYSPDSLSIYFDIPMVDSVDITSLNVIGSIAWDAVVTPGLAGKKDLSQPFKVTITGGDKATADFLLIARYK